MWINCPICGTPFDQDQPWKKLCVDCWKAKKGLDGSSGWESWERRRIRDLEAEVWHLETELSRTREELFSTPEVPTEFILNLKKIISLCHPDKHAGSEVATEITKMLLNLRDRYAA